MESANFSTHLEFSPNVLSLQYFVKSLGLEANRSKIREQLKTSNKYPLVSVNDISQTLASWNIECMAFKAKPEILSQLDSPFIAHYNKKDDKYFVVVKEITPQNVRFYSPDQGEISEPFEEFLKKWTGVIMVAGTDNYRHENIETNAESKEAELYQNEGVKIIPEFLSPAECQALIDFTEEKNRFQRSEVIEYATGKVAVTDFRTSYSAVLPTKELPILSKIKKKVAKLLNVPLSYIEDLQCVRYGEGQEFKAHHDSGKNLFRMHTLLIYLNDDFEGGETYFPELFFSVKPKQGNALYFLDQDSEGNIIHYSFHAGLPVKNGIKYACNIWVRDRPYVKMKK